MSPVVAAVAADAIRCQRGPGGRFLTGPDPLQALGVRVPASVVGAIEAAAQAQGVRPTALARELLIEGARARRLIP
jgi:hypothetical protein